MFSAEDHRYMARALELAERGLYTTTPNPRVGCVVVREGAVAGEGWHERAGAAHAEVNALAAAGSRARGATAYVSLEPCAHQGRTAPCARALLEAGVARVVAAMRDPNPLVSGKGLDELERAGVAVAVGVMEEEARELNIGFVSRMTRGRPWVRLKVVATLDGRTALPDGRSQWITGAEARRDGHRWRARACAILTGIGTVRADDPRLTVREVETPRQPLRVIVDSRLEKPAEACILQGDKVLVFAGREGTLPNAEILAVPNENQKVHLPRMLEALAKRGVNELHVEAGFRLNGSLAREGCVDEYLIYLNASFLGDGAQGMFDLPAFPSLDSRIKLKVLSLERLGDDLRILARPG
jgi:diaminohydroxyphosphoribosylaminopyrimidine deaminase / 5-amino-6-(5-phosphoribosylamino)uracil reductase